jgi:4-alpha-glucanotransferase
MPVYHWENMKKDQFTWWRNRIRRNLEFCDLIRFDHFRGFSAFWEVPSGEVTAVKGKWKPSLGLALFHKLSIDYPTMPFVAEDLGDIDEAVYKLRDTFRFPGLEVLQFAFSSDMSKSVHIPFNHKKNSIAYTGTHDNNTIKGWFKSELSREYKLLLNAYLDKVVKIGAVHLDFIRMCYNSVAFIAIIPMQDHLGLDSHARLNNPALVTGNWTWKLRPKDLSQEVMDQIRNLSKLYGRI